MFDVQFDEPDQRLRILAIGRVLSRIVDREARCFACDRPMALTPSPRDPSTRAPCERNLL
jgi:hypothetical protein